MIGSTHHNALTSKDIFLTEVYSASYSLYDLLSRAIPKSFVYIVLTVVFLPLILLLVLSILLLLGVGHLSMMFVNYRLKRILRDDIMMDHTNYSETRNSLITIDKMLDLLNKFNHDPDMDFFLIRPYINQANTTRDHLLLFRNKVELAFKNLDTVNYPGNTFKVISQDELWANRSKAYDYLV